MQRPRKQPRTFSLHAGHILIAALLLAIIAVLSTAYRTQLGLFLRNLEPSCSISFIGATITVQAWSANDDCEQMLFGPDNFTGVDWKGGHPASEVSGTITCEYDLAGRHLIVRDAGSGQGDIVCTMISFHLGR